MLIIHWYTFIKFLSPEEKTARIKGEEIQLEEITGLEMFFDLDITKDAQIELVIDKDSGNVNSSSMVMDMKVQGQEMKMDISMSSKKL